MAPSAKVQGPLVPRGEGRVVYLCQWTGTSGGIQVLYEHVRLLRGHGVPALLGAHGPFRRCSWFANDPSSTPALDDCLAKLRCDDVLVTPEICIGAPELDAIPARRVAFVQNPALLRTGLDGYARALVPAWALVPWLRRTTAFTGGIEVVPGFLHAEFLQPPRSFARARPRVLLVDRPDKNQGEPARVRDRLRQRGGIEVTYVDHPMPRDEFVRLFRTHDAYLHLSHPEGFPISILEAFGAGCLVVGFAGIGGLEFMRDRVNCFVVADGDADGVVGVLDGALARSPLELDAVLHAARETARAFPEQATAGALVRVFARDPTAARA
ncbi:MAG: glycosyltransferase [Planctomycetota bacterium]